MKAKQFIDCGWLGQQLQTSLNPMLFSLSALTISGGEQTAEIARQSSATWRCNTLMYWCTGVYCSSAAATCSAGCRGNVVPVQPQLHPPWLGSSQLHVCISLLTAVYCGPGTIAVVLACHKNLNIIHTLVWYVLQTLVEEPWENVSLAMQYAHVLCHPMQTCSLILSEFNLPVFFCILSSCKLTKMYRIIYSSLRLNQCILCICVFKQIRSSFSVGPNDTTYQNV